MVNKSLELLLREMIDVLTGRVKVALISDPLPVSGTVAATIVNPLPISGSVTATVASTVISSFTKPYIIPAHQIGAATHLDVSAGATVRAGPLTVGSVYRVSSNVACWLNQGTVAVVSIAGDYYLDVGQVAYVQITAGMDYISALSELGAIAGGMVSINLVTIP